MDRKERAENGMTVVAGQQGGDPDAAILTAWVRPESLFESVVDRRQDEHRTGLAIERGGRSLLESRGIEVRTGVPSLSTAEVVRLWLAGELESGGNTCSHGSGDHRCGKHG